MKAAWKYEDITYEVEQLAAYQRQLSLRMLYHLNATTEAASDAQGQRLAALESRIVEVLAVSDNKLDSILRQGATLHRRLDESETRGIVEDRTVTVVLKLENGDTKVLSAPGKGLSHSKTESQVLMTLKSESDSNSATAKVQDFEPIQQNVLENLFFRRYCDRYDGLKPAHVKTYQWIYDPSINEEQQAETTWSPLVTWLESGGGCYWVNGKAGSGKSTLMKFIAQHPQTQAAVKRWARSAGGDLIQASFFFFNLGTDLQKTRTGLLRALLYDVLRLHPHLISNVMPELWLEVASRLGRVDDSPSDSELLKWFHRLLGQASNRCRFFFLIDGIDEYEGDHVDLANTIIEASADPNIKFLISSRPLPSCVYSFSRFPTLRLQDLTQGDIRQYAEDSLKTQLEERYGEQKWDEVMAHIAEKSSGVFLWVVLVVKSLIRGLQNWDSFDELLTRLEELPSDLKDLYAHMLKRLTPEYRHQASKIFQLCLLALDKQNDPRLFPPRQLHFAQADIYDEVTMGFKPYSKEEETRLCEAVDGRLRSRCYGLLELKSAKVEMKNFNETTLQHVSVEFIHRTAVEFLRLPEVFRGIASLTEATSFNPVLSMFRSCILLCKTLNEKVALNDSLVRFYTGRALEYASLAEEAGTPVLTKQLEALDATFSHHLRKSLAIMNTTQSRYARLTTLQKEQQFQEQLDLNTYSNYSKLSRRHQELMVSSSFHALALQSGLVQFFRECPPEVVAVQTDGGSSSQATRLLYDGINSLLYLKPWPRGKGAVLGPRCAEICSILLAHGANPNTKFTSSYKSSWDLMLDFAGFSAKHKKEFHLDFQKQGVAYLYSRLLIAFLKHGADPNSLVAWPHLDNNLDGQAGSVVYYSILKAFDCLYSELHERGDPFDPWSSDRVAALPKELKTFHTCIVTLIQEKGGKAKIYDRGGLKTLEPKGRIAQGSASGSSSSLRNSRFSFKKMGEAISGLMK